MPENSLTQIQLRKLRSKAQTIDPTIMVGKNGLSEDFYGELDRMLDQRELVKGKFIQFKDERKTLAPKIAQAMEAHLVTLVGNVFVIFRQNPDQKKRKISI
ncbi:MAG: YhbY family RNA-binding protein [Verrucomicrobiota bacterium]|nr:YhbY family RNA-binding protein [Verrucomicrobiota bacterium]